MTEQVDQKLRVLKGIVILLGVLLVLSFFVLVGMIAFRAANMGDKAAQTLPATSPVDMTMPAALRPFSDNGDVIPVPSGARVLSVAADGPHYLITIERGGAQALLIVERSGGRIVRLIDFVPRPE